ncbi:MAG TPA: hypothetical protein VMP01_20265 [Pirellulaceae bacterium]|nr:hypothetical protein [Pirellulaceae bacterium]
MSQYPWLLLAVYVVTIGVVQLLALWAATSTRPWLLRALAVWAPIALLATIRVYEPALVLLVSAALTIGIHWAVQRIGQPRDPAIHPRRQIWRFRLADLLVLMLFLATWLGITTPNVPPDGQFQLPLPVVLAATPLVLLTLFVHRAVTGPQRVRATLLALSVIWICALLLRVFQVGLYLGEGRGSLSVVWSRGDGYVVGSQGAVLTGLAVCLAMAIGVWNATKSKPESKRRRYVRLAAIIVASLGGMSLAWMTLDFLRAEPLKQLLLRFLDIGIHSISFFALAGFIVLGIWMANSGWGENRGWQRHAARTLAWSLAAIVLPFAAWLYWPMLWYAPYPPAKNNAPNQYDRIAAIAKSVQPYRNARGPLPPDVNAALDEAVLLLRSRNQTPLHVRRDSFRRGDAPDRLSGRESYDLSMWLRIAAETAANNRQFDLAADYAMAVIRFDAMFDRVGGHGSGYWGYRLLINHSEELSPAKAREMIDLLAQTLAERDTPEFLAAWDVAQQERIGGWHSKLKLSLARLTISDGFDYGRSLERIHEQRRPLEAKNRLLQADLAIHIYQREQGRLPQTLAELTPGILPEVPIDPYSGLPLIYRPHEKRFQLYSVGPNGEDDGGTLLSPAIGANEGDLGLQ